PPTDGTVLPPAEPAPPVEAPPPPPRRCRFVYRMLFPVLGGKVGSIFGEARDGGARRHLGVDIVAPRLTPLIAVANGVVEEVHGPGPECCWIKLRHNDGWISLYLHLNNDTVGTDDGRGNGIRPGIEVGTRVTAGQVIGWMGDSGNAEPTVPHLHFELRTRGGVAIDPLWSLHTARRRGAVPALEGVEGSFTIPYVDDEERVEADMFVLLTSIGALSPCDTWGTRVCPLDPISVQDASRWASALMEVEVPLQLPGPDLTLTADESLLADAFSCLEGTCPLQPLTAGVATRMLRWAVNHQAEVEPSPTPEPNYWLEDPTVAWGDLAARGLLSDCNTDLTPETILSRGAFARLLGQVTGQLPIVVCDGVT
ncbi:MAG: M23 family metallopeptidase, partial [Acidimicrobiia bacterium]